jgi:hypothetical protein
MGLNHKPKKEEMAMRITAQPPNFKDKYFHSHLKMKLKAKTTKTKEIRKEGKPNPWKRRPER